MPNRGNADSFPNRGKSNKSQFQDSDLEQVELFFYKGNLNEALKKLVKLEEMGGCNLVRMRGKILKSLIFTQMGDVVGGLNLADQVIEESQQIGELLVLFDAIVAKGSALFGLGELDTCFEVIKTAENILIPVKAKDQPEYIKRDSRLRFLRGKVYRKKGDLDLALHYLRDSFFVVQEYGNQYEQADILNNLGIVHASRSEHDPALDFLMKSLELFVELDNQSQVIKLTNNIGMIYWLKGELDQALEYYKRSLVLSDKEKNKRDYALILLNIGLIHRNKGDLDPALDYLEKGLKIYEELRSKSELATFYNNIGVIFQIKGELDEALEYYQKSLVIAEELGDKQEIATSLGNIGDIYQYQGNNKKAVSYYKKSLELFIGIGNDVNTSRLLLTLITIFETSKGDHDQLNVYLEKLRKIESKEKNKLINQVYRLGKAITLKSSGRIIDIAEAQQIFKEITQEEILYIGYTV
ncbi:MAG: tetratricopeptide repeat protein, partial [Candidatus Hodarchaeota archaeon]